MGDIEWSSTSNPRIKKYSTEHKELKIQEIWTYKDPQYPDYPTEIKPICLILSFVSLLK